METEEDQPGWERLNERCSGPRAGGGGGRAEVTGAAALVTSSRSLSRPRPGFSGARASSAVVVTDWGFPVT